MHSVSFDSFFTRNSSLSENSDKEIQTNRFPMRIGKCENKSVFHHEWMFPP